MKHTDRILFVCVENAGRSQMAEALAKHRGISAMSAGTVRGRKLILDEKADKMTVVEAAAKFSVIRRVLREDYA